MSCEQITLPDLVAHCPYPVRVNPRCRESNLKSEEWILKEANFTERKRKLFLGLKAGVLTSLCYPDADDFHLQMSSDYLTFLFTFDDWSDEFDPTESDTIADCIMAALRDPHGFDTDKTVGKLTKSYFSRYIQTAGPGSIRRFIDTMDLYLQAVTQQATDRTDQAIPDLETYIGLRRDTSACRPCFALMEFVAGVDLPDEVASHPAILAMEEATNDLVSWSNDIFSFNVEQSRRDTHNLVAVIMHTHDLDTQAAVDFAGDLCHKSIERFEAERHTLPSWGPEVDRAVEAYVQGLQDWIVGSLHWSFITKRYFGQAGPEVKKHRTVKLLAPAGSASKQELEDFDDDYILPGGL